MVMIDFLPPGRSSFSVAETVNPIKDPRPEEIPPAGKISFYELIEDYLAKRKMTKKEFCNLWGTSPQNVASAKYQGRSIGLHKALRAMDILRIPYQELERVYVPES